MNEYRPEDAINNLGKDIYFELVDIFYTQFAEMMTHLETQKNSQETDTVVQTAHKIKSSARNIGAYKLGNFFELIETNPSLSQSGYTPHHLSDLLTEFKNEILNLSH